MRDFHVHSNYSDGRFLFSMLAAADQAGLDAVGIADHCVVGDREAVRNARATFGFTLDETYERRRRGIDRLRDRFDARVYDAVEMDYDPRDEDAIRAFLADAGFDYAIGSVHELPVGNVQSQDTFAGLTEAELDRAVDRYYDRLVALVESELFDVAAHPDLVERTDPLRGRSTAEHYRRAAEAFADSRTVPEINAGRALSAEIVHPAPGFLDALREHGVDLAVGSDAHASDEVGDRAAFLREFLADRGIKPVDPPGLD